MEKIVKAFFEKEKIEYFGSAKISERHIVISRKLPEFAKYVTMFLVPYKNEPEKRNVSYYAVAKDYHYYTKEIEKSLRDQLEKNGITEKFRIFSDNSPFDERKLACELHLGFIGENNLLINEEYGSFVFLAELVTEKNLDLSSGNGTQRSECEKCNMCKKACPTKFLDGKGTCMSEISQKKNLSDDEKELLKKHYLAWGCDICQQVCPYNKRAKNSPIEFFSQDLLPYVTSDMIEKMDEKDFAKRAYAWRGKSVIMRNFDLTDIL